MTLRDLGEQRLKDIDEPERIYQLAVEGLRNDFPPLRVAKPRSRRRLAIGAALGLIAAAAVAAIVLATIGGSGPPAATAAAVSAARSASSTRPRAGSPPRSTSEPRRRPRRWAPARSGRRTSTVRASRASTRRSRS